MKFPSFLDAHLRTHPAAQARDILKFCYQAARGAEHLLTDSAAARRFFDAEFSAAAETKAPLYEILSDDFCRVHLGAWKAEGLPGEWLFGMFAASACAASDAAQRMEEYLHEAERQLTVCGIPAITWQAELTAWRAAGMPAVHHSEAFRAAYRPAYRLVNRRLLRLLPILQEAAKCSRAPAVIAIDGRAASGKSTMADQLASILGGAVVHMDDFFLPPAMRSEERFAEPGGNVHYERFAEEVLPHLRRAEPFRYRRFDCSVMDYGDFAEVPAAKFRIAEGSYALHPAFGDYADITVFSDVDAREQMRRILRRNGEAMAEMFRTRWIPLEEAYFDACGIRGKAEVTV